MLLDAPSRAELAKGGGEEIGSDSQLAREGACVHRLLCVLQSADDALGQLRALRGGLASGACGMRCRRGLSASSRLRRRGHPIRRRSERSDFGEGGVADGLDELVDEFLGEPRELGLETVRRHLASDDNTRGAAVVLSLDGNETAA